MQGQDKACGCGCRRCPASNDNLVPQGLSRMEYRCYSTAAGTQERDSRQKQRVSVLHREQATMLSLKSGMFWLIF